MTRMRRLAVALLSVAVLAVACTGGGDDTVTIRLLTHDDFDLPMESLDEFTDRTGIQIAVFREPSSTAIVDLLARTTESPVADLVVGVDTLDLTRAIDERLFESYRPIDAEPLDPRLVVDGDWATPISSLSACLNRNVAPFELPELEEGEFPDLEDLPPAPPSGFDDLIDPLYGPRAAIPDATTSRMGLYFLVALERQFPEPDEPAETDETSPIVLDNAEPADWTEFLQRMLLAGVQLTETWEAAYFELFAREAAPREGLQDELDQQAGDEETPPLDDEVTLTWGSNGMPATSVRFQPEIPEDVDIAVIDAGCVEIVNYVAMVRGTPQRRNTGRVIDVMVEPLFQFQIPDRFGSRPARADIIRTDAWREHGVTVDAVLVDPDEIGPRWPQMRASWGQIVRAFEEEGPPEDPIVEVTLPDR